MHYLLFYSFVTNILERRAPYRDAHLALAREAHARGELLMAGAFEDPTDGAVLVFRTDDAEVVRDFVRHDPYVGNGLVTRWDVRAWQVGIGG